MGYKVDFYRHSVGEEELQSIRQTFDGLFLALGPRVGEFEERLADYLEIEHVVGTSSCSMSLILALRALDIGEGDEVITTPMTFASSSNAVLHVGADLVFADIDPATGLLDPERVEEAITDKTRAIIPVHLYGQLADMRAFRRIADEHDLHLVEDAAHAVESRRDGYRTGELGDIATFSFYATKNMTSGDGGALACHSEQIARRLSQLRNHGISKDAASRHGGGYEHWDMLELGYKAPMTDIEAAMLLPQLEHLDARRERRQRLVERYEELLAERDGVDLVEWTGTSAHHLFTVQVPEGSRDAVLTGLGERGIGCTVNYRAVHTLDYYRRELGFEPQDFPAAYRFGRRTVSLPLWPDLPPEQVDIVVDELGDTLDSLE